MGCLAYIRKGSKVNQNDWGDIARALTQAYKETYQWEDKVEWDEEVDYDSEVVRREEKRPSDYKRMLMGVMKHLRETGADTMEILRDNELNEWWGGEVAKIEAAERKAAAKERAMSVLSPEERRALGLKF